MEAIRPAFVQTHEFDAATIGALAHLYRGEIYRSTIWRTLALSATRATDKQTPLQDAIYAEKISRLLPTYSISSRTDDALVLLAHGRRQCFGALVPAPPADGRLAQRFCVGTGQQRSRSTESQFGSELSASFP
jgi:hypothetical protein